MATKTKATQQKEATAEKDAPETPDSPLPLLDLSDAAVRKLIKSAKKRGYVTYEQLNAVLPSEEVTSEQIVITSYSIHYTKLYDVALLCWCENLKRVHLIGFFVKKTRN